MTRFEFLKDFTEEIRLINQKTLYTVIVMMICIIQRPLTIWSMGMDSRKINELQQRAPVIVH